MIRLHIWLRWRLAMRWLYEHTHEPDSRWLDEWADELHRFNAEARGDGRLVRINGETYRRTWAGLIRVEKAAA